MKTTEQIKVLTAASWTYTCPSCGYKSQSSTGRTCPECKYTGDWIQPGETETYAARKGKPE